MYPKFSTALLNGCRTTNFWMRWTSSIASHMTRANVILRISSSWSGKQQGHNFLWSFENKHRSFFSQLDHDFLVVLNPQQVAHFCIWRPIPTRHIYREALSLVANIKACFPPAVNPVTLSGRSYQNLSDTLLLRNCLAMIQANVGPVRAPDRSSSAKPPGNRSMSSTCLKWQRLNEMVKQIFLSAVPVHARWVYIKASRMPIQCTIQTVLASRGGGVLQWRRWRHKTP